MASPPALGLTLALTALAFGVAWAASWLRSEAPGVGVVATVVVALVWAALWWWVSGFLPHAAELPWWGLLPGAALVGIGAQLLHLAAVNVAALRTYGPRP